MPGILIPLAAFAVLGLAGTAASQDAVQTSPGSDAGSAGEMEVLTCADLNEMEPEEATAFLRGYQYARTADSRSGDSDATASTPDSTEPSSSDEADVAATTGDVGGGAEATATTDVSSQAILDSCFDMPATTLDEAFKALN
jgi:hypothetical protein